MPVPEEQEVLKHIYALRSKGLGARKIAKQIQNSHPGYETRITKFKELSIGSFKACLIWKMKNMT